MKLIGYLQGISAMREKPEEYLPERGVVQSDLIELVRTRYQFEVFPQIGQPLIVPFLFQRGKFTTDTSFAINQLIMRHDSDIVAATTTEQTDSVLEDLVKILDDNLGYRLKTSNKIMSWVSNLVVEFDGVFDDYIVKMAAMSNAINEMRAGMPKFSIKRMAFGHGGVEPIAITDPLSAVERADFLIETRSGTPYQPNRYFSSAPLRTAEHIALLERIEEIVRRPA
jgi:hypothetical protein